MKMSWLGRFTAILVSLSPAAARAGEPVAPHDGSFTDGVCANCHTLYLATESGARDYSSGCNDCHAGPLTASSARRFPTEEFEAKPGVSGSHHSWTGYADNPAAGAVVPSAISHKKRLVDGRLQCAVCHSVHLDANPAFSPNSRHTRVTPVGSVGVTLSLAVPGTKPRGYQIRVQEKGLTGGKFIFTKTAGKGPGVVWMNWDGAKWIAGHELGTGRDYVQNSPQEVEVGDELRIMWSGPAEIGDKWDVLVSYPGLRMSAVDDDLCVLCHQPMVMRYTRTAGMDSGYVPDGSRVFSHPVGDALNANGLDNDELVPRDANGQAQSGAGDGNDTNQLKMSGGVVRCTTCHAVHGADSNSLTDDSLPVE